MKRVFLGLMILLALACPAVAEETPAPSESTAPTQSASATPAPTGVPYDGENFSLTLPEGLEPLDEERLAAYLAAAQSDYPDAARTLLTALREDGSAAFTLSAIDSAADALSAANEAAQGILGSADTVAELSYGENRYAAFACAIDDKTYGLYFISNGTQIYIAGLSGLTDAETAMILESLRA